MGCKNKTNTCGCDDVNVCPCDNYEDTITDEEFAKQLKYKVGDIVVLRGRRVRIDEVDIASHARTIRVFHIKLLNGVQKMSWDEARLSSEVIYQFCDW